MGLFDKIKAKVVKASTKFLPGDIGDVGGFLGGGGGGGGGVAPASTEEEQIKRLQLENLLKATGLVGEAEPALKEAILGEGVPDEIQELLQQRLTGALRGEATDPVLEEALRKSRELFETEAAKRLGPGFLQSTAGIQGFGNLAQQEALSRFRAGQEQIKSFSGLLSGRTGLLSDIGQRDISNLQNIAAGRTGLLGAGTTALQPFQFERSLSQRALESKEAAKTAETQAKFGLLGTVAGAGLGAALPSSKDFKKDIKELDEKTQDKIADDFLEAPMHSWKYKEEGDDVRPHIGFITEKTTDKVLTTDGKAMDMSSTLGAMHMAIKKVSKEVEKLTENNMRGGLLDGATG